MEDCIPSNKYGFQKMKLFEKDADYLKINCILNDSLKLEYGVIYPQIFSSTKEKYLEKIKMFILADKKGLKYLPFEIIKKSSINPVQQKVILIFKDKNFERAVLYKLFYQIISSSISDSPNFYNEYILQYLKGYSNDYIKRFFMRYYIINIIPRFFEKEYTKIIGDYKFINEERYMKLYNLAKNYDNFELFDEFYNDISLKSRIKMDEMSNSSKFKKALKTTEPLPFKFTIKNSISKNPLYQLVESDIKKYAKKIGYNLE